MPTSLLVPRTYVELRRGVTDALLKGQQRAELVKLETYHETGRLINEHVRINGAPADYGREVILRLARDLEVARTTLYECTVFARYFKKIRGRGQLVWTHYRLFGHIADDDQREKLVREIIAKNWTTPQLEQRVRALNSTLPAAGGADGSGSSAAAISMTSGGASGPVARLAPRRGTPGLYRIVRDASALVVDLGFNFYRRLPASTKFGVGDIVRVGEERVTAAPEATKADLFTYPATVHRIVDGDTLIIGIDVAPDTYRTEKLRLRGLDCASWRRPKARPRSATSRRFSPPAPRSPSARRKPTNTIATSPTFSWIRRRRTPPSRR